MLVHSEETAAAGGSVLTLRLAAGSGPNVISPQLVAELGRELARAAAEDEIGAVVLTHSGRAFCAGTDLAHLAALAADRDKTRSFLASIVGLIAQLETLPKVTIAAVEGAAVGGGFELALACDLRVFGADAWAQLPEITLGAIPGGGGVQRLSQFIGRGRATEAVLLARRLSARDCADLGLATEVPAGSALETALRLAGGAAGRARGATAAAKQLIRLSGEAAMDVDDLAVTAMTDALCSAEGAEGLSALAEKREPDFRKARNRRQDA